MAIDKKAWYRRLHLEHAMGQQELRQKHNIEPLQGPVSMGHDDECEECSLVRSAAEQNKVWVKEHADDPNQKSYRDTPTDLGHGNNCPACNSAVLSRLDYFSTGTGEGK